MINNLKIIIYKKIFVIAALDVAGLISAKTAEVENLKVSNKKIEKVKRNQPFLSVKYKLLSMIQKEILQDLNGF
ncbi:hypothetical protein SAMN05443633_104229 [Chryseobacterium arachidis]|uniref:Uncharacterized protein n=1 Tax=Chryseobacterium arachidis TaxID=1416778 RepID=A0A1M5BNI9_9FLAO|nr:hypothetical protein [Chryseobacterium arachidis]SHF43945.1 hypothetical protein SAMN05443633_104229 [Chryseobacterium arachidis]